MANKQLYRGERGGVYTLTKTGERSYKSRASRGHFCGAAGGAAKASFPVNNEKRYRAALSYSRFAKRPCALKQAAKRGWKCGCNKRGSCSRH
jgi:hypothetical protein